MSCQSLADVFAYVQVSHEITSTEVLVLLAIANHASPTGEHAYPTLTTLQKCTKLARRTITYALRHLEAKRLIDITLVRGKRGRQTYHLLLPHVPLSKGAPDAPFVLRNGVKGAPGASLNGVKGATDDILKVHQMHLELVRKQQEEREEKPVTEGMESWITPGSQLWRHIEGTVSDEGDRCTQRESPS